MRRLILGHTTEFTLLAVLVVLCTWLSFQSDRFFTIANAFDVLNVSAVNIIFAVGLLVVLISGGIDISFAVAASVVQYVTAIALGALGGARLGGGKGSVIGCVLGVLTVSITQNGLNLMGVSPFAFKMIVGAIILAAITLSSARIDKILPFLGKGGAAKRSAQ